MLQDACDQIACLTGVSLSENRPMNPTSNSPASNSVSMELSRRFPSLRMPTCTTPVSPAGPRGSATTSLTSTSSSGNRATLSRTSSTRNQASRKRYCLFASFKFQFQEIYGNQYHHIHYLDI
jgi:hypothetical protein